MPATTILHPSTGLRLPVAEPDDLPRCTIYALHGGGLCGAYWDCPTDETLSLARLAAAAGFRVAFPDRPGHRTNEAAWPGGLPANDEAALHIATILELWPDEPIFLLAQSAGSMVALRAAAIGALPGLIGVEYSGAGLEFDVERARAGLTLESFWGPLDLYPPATFTAEARVTTRTTGHDGESAFNWAGQFAAVAAAVQVPVRMTMADHEGWWGDIVQTQARIASGFTASTSVETNVEYAAGHNLSVGLSARAYHLGVLAFVERCMRRAKLAGS